MKHRTNVSLLLLVATLQMVVSAAQAQQPPTSAPDNDFILRGVASEMADVLARHGLTEVGRLDSPPPGEGVCVVRADSSISPEQVIADITSQEPSVIAIEEVFLASLPETYDNVVLNQAISEILGALGDTNTVLFDKDSTGADRNVWTGYVEQDADGLVQASQARGVEKGDGVIVAILDTGIDPDHALFDGHLLPGYDFILDQAGDASELGSLDESTVAILGESTVAILGTEEVVVLNESTVAILGENQINQLDPNDIPDAFGHGTMVAGIIHLVAPEAKIMPLRVFDGDGHASVFDIVRAINYAVDNGATVIHMSFSIEVLSQELVAAVDYADQNGVIVVASVGNQGLETMVYPAGLCNVFGVAATDVGDYVSSFSNLGNYLVDIAAPGESVITAYPGGGWAGASGTSFAAPWVSGAVALLADAKGDGSAGSIGFSQVNDALSWADQAFGPGSGKIGHGRANIKSALDNLPLDPPTGGSGCSGSSNLDPSVTITAPTTGSSFNQGDNVTFTGTASDTEDGDLTSALVWVSSLDGTIGTGGSLSTGALSLGTHAISASVTDSVLLNDSDAITLTVGPPLPALPTNGRAVWGVDGSTTPKTNAWDGTTFGTAGNAATGAGSWRIMAGAASPTREETIVVGVDSGTQIKGMIRDGSSWSRISISGSTSFGSVSQTYWWGAGVAYESLSGDALVVYNDRPNLKYSVWNGGSWTGEATINSCVSSEPKHMRLAADPTSDEMVLVVNHSDGSETDCALVWDGSSWGNAVTLDSTSSQDRTDIHVAYESQSGDALVVYNNNTNASMAYRTWNGTTWSGESTISAPSGPSGYARWAVMASDPMSDRIVLGVQTSDPDGWVTVWDGAGWETALEVTVSSLKLDTNTSPNLGVAFESDSGEALAVYGRANQNVFFHRTWSSGGGWSIESVDANLGANTNSMVLSADPGTDQIMLVIQDNGSDLNYVLWDGTSWGVSSQQETDTGENKNQPFLFLWDQATSSGGSVGSNAPPSVAITAPAGGSAFAVGDSVTFAGTATDPEDGDLNAALSWTSDLDGAIGSGGSFSTTTLSTGSHTITAMVVDSAGSNGSDVVSLTVVQTTTQWIASQDTYIKMDKSDENNGDANDLKLKADAGKMIRALIQFDLSSLPAANIASAKLKLYVTTAKSGVTVNLHRLTRGWTEGTGDNDTGADWDTYDDPHAWTNPGGDFAPATLGSVVPDTKDVRVEVDVTALVQDWVDGVVANDGFLLDATGTNDEIKFGTRENAGKEPLLEITY